MGLRVRMKWCPVAIAFVDSGQDIVGLVVAAMTWVVGCMKVSEGWSGVGIGLLCGVEKRWRSCVSDHYWLLLVPCVFEEVIIVPVHVLRPPSTT